MKNSKMYNDLKIKLIDNGYSVCVGEDKNYKEYMELQDMFFITTVYDLEDKLKIEIVRRETNEYVMDKEYKSTHWAYRFLTNRGGR